MKLRLLGNGNAYEMWWTKPNWNESVMLRSIGRYYTFHRYPQVISSILDFQSSKVFKAICTNLQQQRILRNCTHLAISNNCVVARFHSLQVRPLHFCLITFAENNQRVIILQKYFADSSCNIKSLLFYLQISNK